MSIARTHRVALGVLGAALGLTGLQACTGYSSYPHADGSLTRNTTNTRASHAVMRESLRWTTTRTGQTPSRFAVNLPSGVEPEAYTSIATEVGGEPLSKSNADLPRYSVTRVWVRSGEAKVDVVRPVLSLGKDSSGRYPTQGITIELEGGLEPWRVVRYRPWAIGTLADAQPNFIDAYPEPAPSADRYASGDGAWTDAEETGAQPAWDSAWDDQASTTDTWATGEDGSLPEAGPAEATVPTDMPDVIEINP